MQTLIIVAHPDLAHSQINQPWLNALAQYPERYRLHSLYQTYPDEQLDVHAEQRLIDQHAKIVFQFPLYWFSCPPLLKKWFDQVLTEGWAYGRDSRYALQAKKIALAISCGSDEQQYSAEGKYRYRLAEIILPFVLTFEYIHADYQALFAYYGMEFNCTDAWINAGLSRYLEFLDAF